MREAKRVLAQEVTTRAHGEDATRQVEAAARALFGDASDLDEASIPTLDIPAAEASSLSLADLFVRSGLVASRGEARRKAAEGALWLDGDNIRAVDEPFRVPGDSVLLRFGKKRYRRIRFVS